MYNQVCIDFGTVNVSKIKRYFVNLNEHLFHCKSYETGQKSNEFAIVSLLHRNNCIARRIAVV